MSVPDSTAAAALSLSHISPVHLCWMDVVGDPLRVNTSGADMAFSGTGDPDLDGKTFSGIRGDIVEVSAIRQSIGGTDTVTIALSGIPGLDADLITAIQTRANWQGREARLWRLIRNGQKVQQGGVQAYYTGRIMAIDMDMNGETSTVTASIESYLAVLSEASNASYMSQALYDAGDLSALATPASANGTSGNPLLGSTQANPDYGKGIWGGAFDRGGR